MRKAIAVAALALAFTAGAAVGSGGKAEDKPPNGFPIMREWADTHNDVTTALYRDWETDVEYFLVRTPEGVAITPRLNADGTPYTGGT